MKLRKGDRKNQYHVPHNPARSITIFVLEDFFKTF